MTEQEPKVDENRVIPPTPENMSGKLPPRKPPMSTDQPEQDAGGPEYQPDPPDANGSGPTVYTTDPLEK